MLRGEDPAESGHFTCSKPSRGGTNRFAFFCFRTLFRQHSVGHFSRASELLAWFLLEGSFHCLPSPGAAGRQTPCFVSVLFQASWVRVSGKIVLLFILVRRSHTINVIELEALLQGTSGSRSPRFVGSPCAALDRRVSRRGCSTTSSLVRSSIESCRPPSPWPKSARPSVPWTRC